MTTGTSVMKTLYPWVYRQWTWGQWQYDISIASSYAGGRCMGV